MIVHNSSSFRIISRAHDMIRHFSVSIGHPYKSYHLVVVGGGTGGIASLARFARLNKGPIAAIEPAQVSFKLVIEDNYKNT